MQSKVTPHRGPLRSVGLSAVMEGQRKVAPVPAQNLPRCYENYPRVHENAVAVPSTLRLARDNTRQTREQYPIQGSTGQIWLMLLQHRCSTRLILLPLLKSPSPARIVPG